MTNSHFRASMVVILALIMGGCMNANTRPAPNESILAGASVCQERLVITSKSSDEEGAHFYLGHQFELIGPLRPSGDYLLWILPGSPKETAKPDIYVAENQKTWEPGDKSTKFRIRNMVQVKDNSKETPHLDYDSHSYEMELRYHADGCPAYAKIETDNHNEGDLHMLHPGHAGASRL